MPNSQHLDASVDVENTYHADLFSESRIRDFDKHVQTKDRFRNTKLHWEQIPRANNPSKPLQEKAVNLLSVVVHKLRKNKVVILNQNYLTRITKCKKDQNVNLLKQLGDVLDISFHAKITINGKVYYNAYVIKHTDNGRQIIENRAVLLAQKHFVGKTAVTPVVKPVTESNKDSECAEFSRTTYIYKEKVFENNRSNESNFGKNDLTPVSDKTQETENLETRNTKTNINPSEHHTTKNSEVEAKNDDTTPRRGSKPKSSGKKLLRFLKPRKLSDFYPLSDSDVSTLQSTSNRYFTSRAMNEILQDMARKLTTPRFWSKKGFMAYMTEAIKYEKRDAAKTANMDFRISANLTREESRAKLEEQYLTELEYNLQVGPEWHLKKKLASTLERSKAYSLLTSIKRVELQENGVLRINLTKAVELSQMDMAIILNQAKATHERFEGGEFICVERVEITAPEQQHDPLCTRHSDNQSIQQSSAEPNRARDWQGNAEHDEVEDTDIWSEIKRRFARSFGEDGEAIEKHWLSKLTAKINKESKSLELTASSDMVRDIVETRYMAHLSRLASESGYYLAGFG